MTQPKLDPTLYILTLLRENNEVYNLYRMDGRQFKNETERFAIIDKLVHNGSLSKVQDALGQTYQITDKGKNYFYQLCFEKVLQYLADNNDTFRHVSDILKDLAVSDPDDQLAEAIDLKLRRDDLVFATEDSGVMLNENGQNLLSEQKFGLTQQNQSTSIVNTGVLIQDSQVSHSSFSNFDQSQSIRVGDINSPTQFQQGSHNSRQEQKITYDLETIKELFTLLKADFDKLSNETKADLNSEMDYAARQLEKGKDIKTYLVNIGNIIRDVGINVFANLIASPIYESVKPMLGL